MKKTTEKQAALYSTRIMMHLWWISWEEVQKDEQKKERFYAKDVERARTT